MQDDYSPQWYHRLLANKLDEVRRGECTRLLVFMPPQHGKSELISRKWPAHLLGNDPNTRIMATSYSSDLATYNARQVRKIMRSPKYARIFNRFSMRERKHERESSDRVAHFEMPGHNGYLLSAGIMGAMTGFGFDVGLIDDPIKNVQEADSETYRERLKAAFHAVFETRGRGIGKDGIGERIVGVFTRWHHDDLAGYILELAKQSGDTWEVLSLPAILDVPPEPYDPREIGESLWPERYPPEHLLKRKRNMMARLWEALYQQRPTQAGGSIFKKSWWKHFDPAQVQAWIDAKDFEEIFETWDLGFKKEGSSRVCGLVMMKRGADFFVLDNVTEHMSYVESKDAMRDMSRTWPLAYVKVVEDAANGPAIISDLSSELGGLTPWPPKGVKLDAKEARWNAAAPVVRAGNVYLPPPLVHWVDGFITELASLPAGAHNDQADAFSQGIAYARSDGDMLDDLAKW